MIIMIVTQYWYLGGRLFHISKDCIYVVFIWHDSIFPKWLFRQLIMLIIQTDSLLVVINHICKNNEAVDFCMLHVGTSDENESAGHHGLQRG